MTKTTLLFLLNFKTSKIQTKHALPARQPIGDRIQIIRHYNNLLYFMFDCIVTFRGYHNGQAEINTFYSNAID